MCALLEIQSIEHDSQHKKQVVENFGSLVPRPRFPTAAGELHHSYLEISM